MKKRLCHCALAVLAGVVLALALLWLGAVAPARADPDLRYVATTGTDGGNNCETATNPCATIQHAIDVANLGDEIHVADGTYAGTAGTVAIITKELRIIGAFDPAFNGSDPERYQTVLDARWGGSVISITNAGDVLLMHLTLTHGDGAGNCSSIGCGSTQHSATISSAIIMAMGQPDGAFGVAFICGKCGTLLWRRTGFSITVPSPSRSAP